jgi:MoaA/NifB/PqqE/SkfB family radical SAM enzyme
MLKCPRCPRTEFKLDDLNHEVTLNDFQTGFPIDILNQLEYFVFCGSIGDPIYAKDFIEIVEYIKTQSSARVTIVTNGSYKKSDWWRRLGLVLTSDDQVVFSVDGWDNESNNQYRVNSDFDSIIEGIRTLRATSECCIQWSTIYFAFNQDRIKEIKQLATSLGCDRFKAVKSTKFDGRYLVNGLDQLKPRAEFVANSLIYELEFDTLRPNKYTLPEITVPEQRHSWAKCINFEKEVFIGIDGLVLPCPWFNDGYRDNKFIDRNKDKMSIKNRSFLDILNDLELWSELVDSFDNDPLSICKIKCKND